MAIVALVVVSETIISVTIVRISLEIVTAAKVIGIGKYFNVGIKIEFKTLEGKNCSSHLYW